MQRNWNSMDKHYKNFLPRNTSVYNKLIAFHPSTVRGGLGLLVCDSMYMRVQDREELLGTCEMKSRGN